MLSASHRTIQTVAASLGRWAPSGAIPLRTGILGTQPQLRCYRGEANEGEANLSSYEEALLKIAVPKADEIYRKHIELPGENDLATRQRRLIYRSKQRGWLEVDLLLGTWASENVEKLDAAELDEFEEFVNMETIDIYNVITLRLDVPQSMKRGGDGVVERIQEWAKQSPLGKADPDKYREVKTDAKLI